MQAQHSQAESEKVDVRGGKEVGGRSCDGMVGALVVVEGGLGWGWGGVRRVRVKGEGDELGRVSAEEVEGEGVGVGWGLRRSGENMYCDDAPAVVAGFSSTF